MGRNKYEIDYQTRRRNQIDFVVSHDRSTKNKESAVADWTVLRFISTPSPSHPCRGETTKSNRFLSRMIGVRKTRKAQ